MDDHRHGHAREPDRRRRADHAHGHEPGAITGGGSWDAAWGYLFADTSGCTNLKNNITIDAPVYVRGDLCMENSASITSDLVQVRGKVQIKDIGLDRHAVGPGPGRPGRGRLPVPVERLVRLAVRDLAARVQTNFSSTVPDITKPSVNLSYWYTNAKPGP